METTENPTDVINHYHEVSDFFDEAIDEYEGSSYITYILDKANETINRYFREGSLDYTKPVRDIVIIGKAIESLTDVDLVAPDGSVRPGSIKDIYAKKILLSQNPWSIIYELEVASLFESAGLKYSIVHEGNQPGPDVIIDTNDERVNVECKRRESTSPNENYDNLYEMIGEGVRNSTDIGEDSYFVEFRSDKPLQEEAVPELIKMGQDVVEDEKSTVTRQINDVEYKVTLMEYFSGERELDVAKSDVERWFDEDIAPVDLHNRLSPFEKDFEKPGARINGDFKFTRKCTTISKGYSAFDFNFPTIQDDYYNRLVEGLLSRGLADLSGNAPGILFVHLPAYDIGDMQNFIIQEGDYDPVPQLDRLSQRIEGKLAESGSTNWIVTQVTYFFNEGDYCGVIQGFKLYENQSPNSEMPDELDEFFEGRDFTSFE
jgi:hypothetical protein